MHFVQDRTIMRGNEVNVRDIVLDLEPIPANLLSDEVLQEGEEEELSQQLQLSLYEVGSNCAECDRRVIFTCSAIPDAILLVQQLLLEDSFKLVCLSCVRKRRRNGGR